MEEVMAQANNEEDEIKEIEKNIEKAFAFNETAEGGNEKHFIEQFRELQDMFIAEANAVSKIIEQGFFLDLAERFYKAFKKFVGMANELREEADKNQYAGVNKEVNREQQGELKTEREKGIKRFFFNLKRFYKAFIKMLKELREETDKNQHGGVNKEVNKKQLEEEKKESEKRINRYKYIINNSYQFIHSFDDTLQAYFDADRQFLESPSFHNPMYDLPINLGVIYNLFVQRVIKDFDENAEDDFGYILCPRPYEMVTPRGMKLLETEYIKPNGKTGEKCFVMIEIPAKMLYKPKELFIILAHEVAHYCKRENRIILRQSSDGKEYSARNKMFIEQSIKEYEEVFVKHITKLFRGQRWFAEIKDGEKKIEFLYKRQMKEVYEVFYNGEKIHTITDLEKKIRKQIISIVLMQFENVNISNLVLDISHGRMIDISTSEYYSTIMSILGEWEDRNKELIYIIKEATSDVLAIKLLDIEQDDYNRLIEEEIENSIDEELNAYLRMRRFLVNRVMQHKKKETWVEANIKGIRRDDCRFSQDTANAAFNYLIEVYENAVIGEEAKEMYCSIGNNADTSVLSEYMFDTIEENASGTTKKQ